MLTPSSDLLFQDQHDLWWATEDRLLHTAGLSKGGGWKHVHSLKSGLIAYLLNLYSSHSQERPSYLWPLSPGDAYACSEKFLIVCQVLLSKMSISVSTVSAVFNASQNSLSYLLNWLYLATPGISQRQIFSASLSDLSLYIFNNWSLHQSAGPFVVPDPILKAGGKRGHMRSHEEDVSSFVTGQLKLGHNVIKARARHNPFNKHAGNLHCLILTPNGQNMSLLRFAFARVDVSLDKPTRWRAVTHLHICLAMQQWNSKFL